MRLMLGHDGPPTNYWRENVVTGETLARCPLRTLQLIEERDPALGREYARMVGEYFPHYQRGHLLEAGGLADQPARYVAWMRALAAMDARFQARLHAQPEDES